MSIRYLLSFFIFISSVLIFSATNAECISQCTNAFTKVVQTHGTDPTDKIYFNCDAQINGGDGDINTLGFTNPGCPSVCDGGPCVASGLPVSVVNDLTFLTTAATNNETITTNSTLGGTGTTEYNIITVNDGVAVTFASQTPSTVYKINTLDIKTGSIANLNPGDYWIDTLVMDNGATINVVGTGTVRLFVNQKFDAKNNITLNIGGASDKVIWYSYDDVLIKNNSTINSLIYSKKTVSVGQNSTVNGSILAKNVSFGINAVLNYVPGVVAGVDFGDICDDIIVPENFDLSFNQNGINCLTHNISATVYGCDAEIYSSYDQTITLDTGTGKGTWSLITGNGTLNDAVSNDGLAQYTFSASDNGNVTFGLNYEEGSANVNIQASQDSEPTISGSGNIAFSPSNFIITSYNLPNPPTGPVTPFSDSVTAGVNDTLYLTAYGQSAASPTCGVIEEYTGSKQIKFWQNYTNPTSGTLVSTIDGLNIASTEGGASAQTVTFTSGQASVNFKYRDVGQINISAKDDTVVEPAGGIIGTTNNFVVKPAKFIVSVSGNPGAVDENGGILTQAGENFTVSVEVQDNDGNVTPNYGNETTPQGIRVFSSNLVAPVGGRNGTNNDGVLANNTSFSKTSPGNFQATTIQFDEVGIIKLTAGVSGSDYLGAGDVSGPESSNVGRFTPSYLSAAINTPIIDSGCVSSGFTYLDQTFTYNTAPEVIISAMNKNDVITQNYQGSYWKLLSNTINPTYLTNSPVAPFDSTSAVSDLSFTDNNNGTGTYIFGDGGGFKFNRINATNISPFDAEIELQLTFIDQDGISIASNPYSVGSTGTGLGMAFNTGKKFYHGRMIIGNSLGSELVSLGVPLTIEYYNGSVFTPNLQDSCTSIGAEYLNLSPNPGTLSTTPSISAILNGIGQVNLSNPGASGYVDLEADLSSSNLDYLQFDWAYDGVVTGVFNNNPRGRGTFGISQGESTDIIYLKEIY